MKEYKYNVTFPRAIGKTTNNLVFCEKSLDELTEVLNELKKNHYKRMIEHKQKGLILK